MIDHSEGVLRMRKALNDIEAALRERQYDAARALCITLATDARMVEMQIRLEEEDDAARRPSQG